MADDRKQSFLLVSKQFCKRVKDIFGPKLKPGFFLEVQPDNLQEFFEKTADFCQKAVDFFTNIKWRRKNHAVKNLHNLAESIQKILPDWEPDNAYAWSNAYQNSLWEGLQEAADVISARFHITENEEPVSVETIISVMEDIYKLSGHDTRVKKTLKEYAGDRGRCVALLELEHSERIMAFSGFLDCEDGRAQTALGVSFQSHTVNAFRRISNKLHASLAILSKGVVDYMVRFEPDTLCSLTNRGTLFNALTPPPDEGRKSFIKKSYSCCERKILAYLEEHGKVKIASAIIHVKFLPCLSCYGALREWADAQGINFMLDCPEMT